MSSSHPTSVSPETIHLLTRSSHITLCGIATTPHAWTWPNWPQLPHAQACPECQELRDTPATFQTEEEVANG